MEMEMEGERPRKHLSSFANSLLHTCALALNTSVDALIDEFEMSFKTAVGNCYSRRLVEFASLTALDPISLNLGEKISDGSFSRLTYDMMLAWERPSINHEEHTSVHESVAKEREDKKGSLGENEEQMGDDVPLFYSDIMPLLVNEEPSVGEDAYVWLGSVFPLASDVVNARFAFVILTAATANRLHYPAYDRFLKEMDKCVGYLQNEEAPTGIELGDDEFILHVEGSAGKQRIVRHIGTSSWPGRLTLTNKALYFEASGVLSYEPALKINLWRADVDHQVKAASTGPWGAPLFDKGITYQSSQLSETLVLEFPEMTGSTRRDLWLALIKEVILLHQFIMIYKIESLVQIWEVQSRTVLGVLRLHAAREMLRISPPPPASFLMFALYDDLPKGDYVLEQLADSLKETTKVTPFSATDVSKRLDLLSLPASDKDEDVRLEEGVEEEQRRQADSLASLDKTVGLVREEAKEVTVAQASIEEMKEEGVTDSLIVFMGLLRPLKVVIRWLQMIVSWQRPMITSCVLAMILVAIYIEGVGYALAAFLMGVVGIMQWARQGRLGERLAEVIVIDDTDYTDKTTMENVVEAQQALKRLHEVVKTVNVVTLRIWSLLSSRSPKHTAKAMWVMTGAAAVLAAVPFKYIMMGAIICCFVANAGVAKPAASNPQWAWVRRLREWWECIPVIPVRTAS